MECVASFPWYRLRSLCGLCDQPLTPHRHQRRTALAPHRDQHRTALAPNRDQHRTALAPNRD